MPIYKEKIITAVKQTAVKTFKDLGNYAQSYITEEKRTYPRLTHRKYGVGVTGKVATTPRDMVDSGETRDSFNMSTIETGNDVTVNCTWNTPQAATQYMGTASIPPYPFVHFAINSFEFEKTFQTYWNQET